MRIQCESNANQMRIQFNPIANPIQSMINPFFSYLVLAHAQWHTLALHWVSCCSLLIHCILSFIRTCHIAVKSSVALFICGSCVHARVNHMGTKKPCLLGRVAMCEWINKCSHSLLPLRHIDILFFLAFHCTALNLHLVNSMCHCICHWHIMPHLQMLDPFPNSLT